MSESPIPTPDGAAGLLLCRDLIFTSKVTGTARALGQQVMVAGNVALASAMIGEWRPKVVFIDLAAGDLVAPATLRELKIKAGPDTPFVAFGSHVDTASLEAAAAAGCEIVLPRSRFTQDLP
jgi:CheY-like chemotaxis protein